MNALYHKALSFLINPENLSKHRRLIALFIGLLALLLVYFFYPNKPQLPEDFTNQHTPAPSIHDDFFDDPDHPEEQPEAKPCSASFSWFLSSKQMYDYQLKTDIEINASSAILDSDRFPPTKTTIDVSGTLNFRILPVPEKWPIQLEQSLIFIAFQLSDATVKYAENGQDLNRQADLEKLFQTLFCAAFAQNGLCFKFFFPNNLTLTERASLSELIYAVQLVMPDHPENKEWTVPEVHSLGRFLAEYRIKENNCQLIEKKNTRCISLVQENFDDASLPFSLSANILFSQFELLVDPWQSWIKNCDGSEHIELSHSNGQLWSSSKTSVKLHAIAFNPDPDLAIWSDQQDLESLLLAFFNASESRKKKGTWEKRRKEAIKKRLKNRNFKQLVSQLEHSVSQSSSQSQNARVSHLLQDYLTAYPRAAHRIPEWIKSGKVSDDAVGHMVLILEKTGHLDAQQALSAIITDSEQATHHRVKAIVAAGTLSNPTSEIGEDLRLQTETLSNKGFSEVSKTALLALGTLSHTYQKNGQLDDAQKMINHLKDMFLESDDPANKITCLKAMGNVGNDQLLTVIDLALPEIQSTDKMDENSANMLTQVSAILALGNHPESPETIDRLIPLLNHDQSIIRRAVVDALTHMESSTVVHRLCDQLLTESDQQIRRTIIRYLGDHIDDKVQQTLLEHLDLGNEHPDKMPLSRDEAEDVFRIIGELIE